MSGKPKSLTWSLDEHTKGKHLVLKRYLGAWIAIMNARGARGIQLIDGFAGPGKYSGGEDGSPLIMLREAVAASAAKPITIAALFMEQDPDRAAHLEATIRAEFPSITGDVRWSVVQHPFTKIAQAPQVRTASLVPAFVMVDPFGVSDTPMAVLAQLMKSTSCELYVSVMLDHVARFINRKDWEERLDALFGVGTWRAIASVDDKADRRQLLRDLYVEQLKQNGAKYVVSFELWQEGIYKYTIVFATTHPLGCARMKDAIWDELGSDIYIASRTNHEQLSLELPKSFPRSNAHQVFAAYLYAEYRGRTVSVDELQAYTDGDSHSYAGRHLNPALKDLEARGIIAVDVPKGKRRRSGTFPRKQGYAVAFTA